MNSELAALIRRLNDTKPLTEGSARELYRRHTDMMIARALARADDMTDAAQFNAFIKTERPELTILNQSEEDFRVELRSIDNDLNRQIAIVHEGLDYWFATGLIVPPYYAWRIAVILAKAKRLDEEKAFLSAWCRHFGRIVGGRFSALVARGRKRGLSV